jgi:hypothetical protein
MQIINRFKPGKSLEDLEQENERLRLEAQNEDLQLSLAQKRAIRSKLKGSGLTLKSFGNSFRTALKWLRGNKQQ